MIDVLRPPVSVPPVVAHVKNAGLAAMVVDIQAISLPSGRRRSFRAFVLGGRCILPWLSDSRRMTWLLRDTLNREARVEATPELALAGEPVELVLEPCTKDGEGAATQMRSFRRGEDRWHIERIGPVVKVWASVDAGPPIETLRFFLDDHDAETAMTLRVAEHLAAGFHEAE